MKNIELLSPVGDFECLKAAVQNGADAVYLGASSFSARAKATNFNSEELLEAIKYAKLRNVSVHLALNTLIKNEEFEDAVNLAINAYNLGVDAIIIQDLGLASYLLKNYPEITLHASTQMTVHNLAGVKQLEKMGFKRVVLSRELSLDDIKYIRENTSIELEVFIHGALCISYSGQCLLSSMIGGRSGNRGLCAQPCRLPYELYENDKILDKGYLLSPRDNCSIEYLPELIKLGINSFKIEGRMKTPYYVGVVTRIYRKYIDFVLRNINLENSVIKSMIDLELNKKNKNTSLSDKEELMQVFNRGGFSTGHFKPSGNKELIFKDKPNNMGFYIGTISHINENKGHLKFKLENTLSIGDRISINNESYTVSELMIDNKNFNTLDKGNIVKIGRMKGKFSIGNKIYRIETANLNKAISPTFKENKNFKKILISGEITIKENQPVSLKVWGNSKFYDGLEFIATSNTLPYSAQNKPVTKEKIIEQITKTGSTEFEFENLNVVLDNNLFLQMSTINDLRRTALAGLENLVIKEHTHSLNYKTLENFEINKHNTETKISLLLNILDENFDYSILKNIDKLYIPLKYFYNQSFSNIIKNISNNFKTYVYMPHIIRDTTQKSLDFVRNLKISGFVISHISQLEIVSKYNLEIIGNFNLNIYNNYSINTLKKLAVSTFTLSPELNRNETLDILNKCSLDSEIIVYGKLPVMTNNYCYLGKSNKCYKECDRKCTHKSNFYLKDRMDFKFKILPDNTSTITTIYNSKITSLKYENLPISSIRIDILEESPESIQEIINTIKSGNRFEGKNYTNGNF